MPCIFCLQFDCLFFGLPIYQWLSVVLQEHLQFCRKSVGIYISFIAKQTRDLSCSEEDESIIFFLSINSDKNKEDRSAVLTQQQ